MLAANTWQSFKQAKAFGATGAILGLVLGAAIEKLDPGGSTTKDYVMTAGLGALVVGGVFQVGGMFHTNNTTGGPGLLATPVLMTAGFAGGVIYNRFGSRNNTVIKNNITMGLLGATVGAVTGGGIDWIRTQV
jgi:hypothetical protein